MDTNDLRKALQRPADRGDFAGAATLVWRNGRAETTCAGWRDIENRLPIEPNTVFRIASMSKPITSVAALMLVDEGRLSLSDPIARFAPEFAQTRVLRSPDGPLDATPDCYNSCSADVFRSDCSTGIRST